MQLKSGKRRSKAAGRAWGVQYGSQPRPNGARREQPVRFPAALTVIEAPTPEEVAEQRARWDAAHPTIVRFRDLAEGSGEHTKETLLACIREEAVWRGMTLAMADALAAKAATDTGLLARILVSMGAAGLPYPT